MEVTKMLPPPVPALCLNNPTPLLFTSEAEARVVVKSVFRGFKMALLTVLQSIICSLYYCQRSSALLKRVGGGRDVGVESAAPFPLPGFGLLCWLLFPQLHGFVTVCVCLVCV